MLVKKFRVYYIRDSLGQKEYISKMSSIKEKLVKNEILNKIQRLKVEIF